MELERHDGYQHASALPRLADRAAKVMRHLKLSMLAASSAGATPDPAMALICSIRMRILRTRDMTS